MKIIFQVQGGLGKSIAATAVCKAIKKQYPSDDLIVLTAYPEVFLCNPDIHRTFHFSQLAYFYQDFIAGGDVKMLLQNPYFESEFITSDTHLIQVWCNMFGIEYHDELPELFITNREFEFYRNQMRSPKPIMLIHTNGGGADQENKYSWMRDLPIATAQQIVDHFHNDYEIVHIKRADQLSLQRTTPLQADFRAISVLITLSEKRLFIDSFTQHAAAALGKTSTVCWIGNNPKQYGYDIHTNLMANSPTMRPDLRHSVYTKYNITGNATEFPYRNEAEIFDVNEIIDSLTHESLTSKGTYAKDRIVKDKIVIEAQKGNNVASRLKHLIENSVGLGDVKSIMDIGSCHLGQSIEFARIFSDASIYAFEPVPESFDLCLNNLKNLEKQKADRISVHNIALTNTCGEIEFYPVDPSVNANIDKGFSSMFRFNDEVKKSIAGEKNIQREIKVQASTLDIWCERNNIHEMDIMWVDVQGAELLLFQGGPKILKETKVIMTEVGINPYYEGHTLKTDIDKCLTDLGFVEIETASDVNTVGFNGIVHEINTIYINPNKITNN